MLADEHPLTQAISAGKLASRVKNKQLRDLAISRRNACISRHAEEQGIRWEEAWRDYQNELRKVVDRIP